MRTVIGTAENMEFEDASFDAAIFVASLQFIEDYRSAIAEAARVLRPSGKIVVMLLNPESAYFKENTKAPDSYMSKIKHRDLAQLKKVMKEYYSVQTEYYLGIKGKEIFPSSDPAVASLYIINGIKG